MEIIYVLIPLSFIFLAMAIYLFFWAVNNDQFSDLEGPSHSILFDDHDIHQQKTINENNHTNDSTNNDNTENKN